MENTDVKIKPLQVPGKILIPELTEAKAKKFQKKRESIVKSRDKMSGDIIESLEFRIAQQFAEISASKKETANFDGFILTCRELINNVARLRKYELSCSGNTEISEDILHKIEELSTFLYRAIRQEEE